jgi:hypothetical protein
MPITRCMCVSHSLSTMGAAGDTTPTDPRAQRNRASRRGGQLTTRAHSSSYGSACPHLRAPGAPVPDGRTIHHNDFIAARTAGTGEYHTGSQPTGTHSARNPPTHPCGRRIPGWSIRAEPNCGQAAAHRRNRMVDQEVLEHRAAEGPADERSCLRLSQWRAPLSPNQMCEKLWTLPRSAR